MLGPSVREVLWKAQDGRCWICTGQMHRKASNHPRSCTLDHVWPKARFGSIGDIGVTLLACRECNAKRGSPLPSDFDVRALVTTWRKVDRSWLRWNLVALEAELRTLEIRRSRVELLKLLEAA